MAIFTAHSAFDAGAIPSLWHGGRETIEATSTTWTFGNADIRHTFTGTGFEFSEDDGSLLDGVRTGWSMEVDGTALFTLTGATYALSGPNSPVGDVFWNGYLGETGYPVYEEAAELAFMLRGDDVVNGSSFGDRLAGFEGNDRIFGNGGNDFLRGWHGNDTLDGGDGVDTAVYLGFRSDMIHTRTATGWETVDFQGIDAIDTLVDMERLVFSNGESIALDMDGNGGRVAKLLGAVFGASFVNNEAVFGIGLQMADQGMSYEALATLAMQARGAFTHDAVVETLWFNLLGVHIDAGNRAHYVGLLDGGMGVGELTVLAAETWFNLQNIQFDVLQQVGVNYQLQGDFAF